MSDELSKTVTLLREELNLLKQQLLKDNKPRRKKMSLQDLTEDEKKKRKLEQTMASYYRNQEKRIAYQREYYKKTKIPLSCVQTVI